MSSSRRLRRQSHRRSTTRTGAGPRTAGYLILWQRGGMIRPFRFGVVAPVEPDLGTWRDRVRRIADLGYSTLLMPDVPGWQPSPAPALAMASTLAPNLRVGSWVYASPSSGEPNIRPP